MWASVARLDAERCIEHYRVECPPPARCATPAPRVFRCADCGTSPDDWCPAPEGDPCGAHQTVAECRADPRCGGLRYRGESLLGCRRDARGFGVGCPTVGCILLLR
jgi:hypothetical protein